MLSIAMVLPSGDFAFQAGRVGNALAKTLTNEDRQFNLDHIEPRAMLWGEVKFKFMQDTTCLRRFKSGLQGGRRMNIEIIQDHANFVGVGKVDIPEFTHQECKIGLLAMCSNFSRPPANTRLENHEQIAHAMALIFEIIAGRPWGAGISE